MKKPNVTMRFGAAHNEIIVDGHRFDRGTLDRKQARFLRNVVIEALVSCGAVVDRFNKRAAA